MNAYRTTILFATAPSITPVSHAMSTMVHLTPLFKRTLTPERARRYACTLCRRRHGEPGRQYPSLHQNAGVSMADPQSQAPFPVRKHSTLNTVPLVAPKPTSIGDGPLLSHVPCEVSVCSGMSAIRMSGLTLCMRAWYKNISGVNGCVFAMSWLVIQAC